MTVLRPVLREDIPRLGELLNDVFRRSQGVHDQDVLRDFPLCFSPENLANCRVIEIDGRIVSHAAVWPRELTVDGHRLKAGVITLVATHPEFRRRGCAARLMEDLQATMQADRYDLGILWTGVPDFYRRLGWETVQPQGWLVPDLKSCGRLGEWARSHPAADRIEPYTPERHLDGILALHEREPVRFSRSRAESAALLSLPKLEVSVLVEGGKVRAYLVHGRACNKRGLAEYGGTPEGILRLIARVQASGEFAAPLPLVVHHTHPALATLLKQLGAALEPLPSSKGAGCEMIFRVPPENVPAAVRSRIFVWGLDVA